MIRQNKKEVVRYEVATAMMTGAAVSGPSPTASTAMNVSPIGALMVAPGTAANMDPTAIAYGMSGNIRCTTTPAVPPTKSIGNTLPPMKPVARLIAIASILPTSTATRSQMLIDADSSITVVS